MDADMSNQDFPGQDQFERDLQAGLTVEKAPDHLYRRIAQIPLEHPRGARTGFWQRLRDRWSVETTSWASGVAAAAASLAIGFWLGFSGMAPIDESDGDSLVAIAFGDISADLGGEL